ncbi:hypothetical protein LKV13_02040 [Borrelia sp. BU AG58]|uniref:hypothetical protein n=1 Tax=Borrelia sp. BU AG58 TaxID=2887345 RepID=UPI001E44FEFF|nr:hypothetical protein [Borrelia sp. BU AG58]UER67585.1 hypothetical protein LKV13_02040 [Borrelia sp. BU AG58]
MRKILKLHLFLLCFMLPFLNAEQQRDEISNRENLTLEESSNRNEYNFFSVERGFTYSTGIGLGTGFFLNSKINHLIFRPYYMFANNSFDFLAVAAISINEDYNISKKLKYSSSYIGAGVNWHIVNLASKTKYFSLTFGVGGRFYLSTNFIGDFKFYDKLPYIIEPYIFFEFSTKRSIPYLSLYSRIDFLFLDTFNISFDFGIRYNFGDKEIRP